MFSPTHTNGFSPMPEVPINMQRFPLRQLQRSLWCYSPQPQQHLQQQSEKQYRRQLQQQHAHIALPGKFPLLEAKGKNHLDRFPMQQLHCKDTINKTSDQQSLIAKPRFPKQMNHLTLPQRFPLSCQLPKRNFSNSVQSISKRGSSPPPMSKSRSVTLKQFPTIKKQFVSFSDNRPQTCKNQHGNVERKEATDVMPTPATKQTTTTVTQTSQNMSTKIDMVLNMDDNVYAHNVDDDLDVHKAASAFDNELNACEQTLNLNVEPAEGVVGEQKEIEHQQAENFNDAFGWRHDHDNDNGGNDNEGNDDVGTAKNKREICEQSKLETTETATVHNELNMTKEQRLKQQQSIRLASEQENQTIAERTTNDYNRQSSDARGSSSEQVDGQEQQPNLKSYVTQSENEKGASSIKILKCAVRELLDKATSSAPIVVDLDLIDLLGELVQLIATPTSTGNIWSVPLVEEQVVVDECADMTVTKVSDDSEAASAVVVDIYNEQIEQQPVELDDNNNNRNNSISSNSNDMKYEVLKSTTRLPETLTSRLSSTAIAAATTPLTTATVAPISALTSRIRDATTTPTSSTSTRPLLGELKRSSSSRDAVSIDVESILPERTLLRRQRRMRSQESVEETPEEVIARLNKLKERISGALSEVKGVLKQYSTESEADATGEKLMGPSASTSKSAPAIVVPKTEEEKQPVQFRFVKKVRRRSYFDEAEEEKEKADDAANLSKTEASTKEIELNAKVVVGATAKPIEKQNKSEIKIIEDQKKPEAASSKDNDEQKKTSKVFKESQLNEDQKKPKESTSQSDVQKPIEDPTANKNTEKEVKANKIDKQEEKVLQAPTPSNLLEANNVIEEPTKKAKEEQVPSAIKPKAIEKPKAQAKLEFLAKVQSELKSKPKAKESSVPKELPKEDTTKAEATDKAKEQLKPEVLSATGTAAKQPATTAITEQPQPVEAVEATPQTAELPKESATQPDTAAEPTPATATKKKIIVKKNPRRASIAAVEPSKIKTEPVQIDALIQRRPSDSEAIVKRKKKLKLTTGGATAIASGSNEGRQLQQEEVTTINEQVVTAKVDNNATTAKSVTATSAKTAKIETQTTAAAAATTVAATAAPAVAAAATTTATTTLIEATAATTVPTAPKQLLIDDVIANQAAASESSRRASLKLAELVGETVLVVPAQTAATVLKSTQDISTNSTAATAISSSLSQSKKPINQTAIIPPLQQEKQQQQQVVAAVDIEVAPVASTTTTTTTQIAATLSEVSHEESSPQQQQQEQLQQQQQQDHLATKDNAQAQENNSLIDMPELKVLTGPVQPVKIETVEQPHDESDMAVTKKKSPHLKKLVRKTSIDKGKEKVGDAAKLSSILKDKNKISNQADKINKLTPPKKQSKPTAAKDKAETAKGDEVQQENAEVSEENTTEAQLELELEPQAEPEPEPKPKKPRQIKKKVIIKRQKRKLSVGDTFFIQQEPEETKPPEIETIEKAIAYVTDDEDDVEPEPVAEPPKPLKSCLHVREYKIGDLVLYAERYRKTQVRWKRGRVLERITSISYKLDIEGKEVAAHISYIKKYTGRKVKFVGKEYLDIEYEQVVEEERRARSYSIWNMV